MTIPAMGPVILDVAGLEITPEECDLLQHPAVGGVILFARNYESPDQMKALCQSIRRSRQTPLLLVVDQEGGRVQRFRAGLTTLPSLGQLGRYYDRIGESALQLVESIGWLMAAEILSLGIDISLAPVLDINKNRTPVVGDRSFHSSTTVLVTLATAFIRGMKKAGMATTGKHFPGHGSVYQDSHLALPIDERPLTAIWADDMIPFLQLQAQLAAIMPAHIVFSAVDSQPTCFSTQWLQHILREKMQFSGVIMSDDLNMAGAAVGYPDYAERAKTALQAGCDMILICNNRPAAVSMVEALSSRVVLPTSRYQQLAGQFSLQYPLLQKTPLWQEHYQLFERATDEIFG